ncbi:MAG: BspA family leucine-rich repeat surface protein, partial [Actinobacteria bacterium]|nr:BspA family leucine-rich repeat surface protein [Actinomycetota bacterium]
MKHRVRGTVAVIVSAALVMVGVGVVAGPGAAAPGVGILQVVGVGNPPDPTTSALAPMAQMAASADGSIVAGISWSGLYVYNGAATTDYYRPAKIAAGGYQPVAVAVSPNGAATYVYSLMEGKIYTYNNSTGTLVASVTVSVACETYGMDVSADGTKLYVARWGCGRVEVYNLNPANLTTAPVLAQALTGINRPGMVTVGPNGKVYIPVSGDGTNAAFENKVAVIDPSNSNAVSYISGVGTSGGYLGGPRGIVFSPVDPTLAYVVNNATNASISTINVTNNTVTNNVVTLSGGIPTRGSTQLARAISISPDGSYLYVAGSGGLQAINLSTKAIKNWGQAPLDVVAPSSGEVWTVGYGTTSGPYGVNVWQWLGAPTLTAISPMSGPKSGGTPVTLTGTGFRSGATVTIDGFTCSNVVVVSDTTITCTTPYGSNGPGARDVVVKNPDNQSGTLTKGFLYTACSQATPMQMTWNTSLAGSAGSGWPLDLPIRQVGNQFGNNAVTIDWGDSTTPTLVPAGVYSAYQSHTYTSAGTYTVTICGNLVAMGATSTSATPPAGAKGFTSVISWNEFLQDASYIFSGWTNLTDVPNSRGRSVTTLSYAFENATSFNDPDVTSWEISSFSDSNVTDLSGTFAGATSFNQNVGVWQTRQVTKMDSMFAGATAFNNGGSDRIKYWSTGGVRSFASMFAQTPFNQPIGTWTVASATSFAGMFSKATAFDQNLGLWTPSAATTMAGFWFTGQNVMSVANYDSLLINWSGKVVKPSVALGFGAHKFTCAAEAARATLSSAPNSWVITDGGLAETAPTISTIVPGNGSLSVYVTAPSCMSTKRTTYEYSTDGGTTWVTVSPGSLASPIVISGLTNGTEYTVKVRAAGGTASWLPSPAPASTAEKATPASTTGTTAKNDTSVYGAAVPTIGYDTKLAAGDWIDGAITCGVYTDSTYTTAVTSSTKPGTYVTHCSGPAKSGLGADLVYADGTYTLTKAPLTITATSFTKTYGGTLTPNGSSDFTAIGLIGSDAVGSVTLTTSGEGASAGVSGSPYSVVPSAAVGTVPSGVLADWYDITYTDGSITVNKAPALSVTAKTYTIEVGSASLDGSSPGFDVTGFVNSETFSTAGYTAPTCAVYDAEVGGSAVGTTYSGLSVGTYWVRCSGGVAGNYAAINYSTAKFVVKGADVQVTGKNGSGAYGSTPSLPSPAYEVSGDLNGATVICGAYEDSAGTTAVTASTKPGTYYTVCTGPANNGAGSPVPIVYSTGTYTVEKAPLTITAKSWSKTYGDVIAPIAASDFTSSGLVNGDAISSVTLTSGGFAGTAGVAGSPYAVTPSAAVLSGKTLAEYYAVTYVDGSVTVGKKTLTVTANNVNLKLGAAPPASYAATYTGWVNGENDTTQQPEGWAAPTCESSFNSTTPVATPVAITCSGGAADDYEFSFTQGTVSVGNPQVTVENTTKPAYETSGSTANVALSATITDWAPGCKVTFTLNPSTGTASPYTVYTTASNDVSVNAVLPVGVY